MCSLRVWTSWSAVQPVEPQCKTRRMLSPTSHKETTLVNLDIDSDQLLTPEHPAVSRGVGIGMECHLTLLGQLEHSTQD